MKATTAAILSLLATSGSEAFSLSSRSNQGRNTVVKSAVDEAVSSESSTSGATQDPLLIRAAKGEKVERTPVWMMRQAGRHIQEYRDLCKKYPTFRQRSEIPEVAVEVSLQPWRNYQTDGCILFSDILTPLPGVGCDFTIDEKLGPIMDPIKTWDDAKKVSEHCFTVNNGKPFLCDNAVLKVFLVTLSFLFSCGYVVDSSH
jgi:uroporphyrinogen decarboxylase